MTDCKYKGIVILQSKATRKALRYLDNVVFGRVRTLKTSSGYGIDVVEPICGNCGSAGCLLCDWEGFETWENSISVRELIEKKGERTNERK